jgi:hypothetical protein
MDGSFSEPAFDVTVQRETFENVAPDLPPLLSDFWSDVARDQALPTLDVNYDMYLNIDRRGALRVYTARWRGELVGVLLFFVSPSLHHKSTIWATSDVFWLRPDARKPFVARRMLRFAEAGLKAEGVHTIRFGEKTARPALGRLLEAMSFEAVEIIYHKVL